MGRVTFCDLGIYDAWRTDWQQMLLAQLLHSDD